MKEFYPGSTLDCLHITYPSSHTRPHHYKKQFTLRADWAVAILFLLSSPTTLSPASVRSPACDHLSITSSLRNENVQELCVSHAQDLLLWLLEVLRYLSSLSKSLSLLPLLLSLLPLLLLSLLLSLPSLLLEDEEEQLLPPPPPLTLPLHSFAPPTPFPFFPPPAREWNMWRGKVERNEKVKGFTCKRYN